ncbi:MAG: NTE family protein [Hyphomicrobiaceae bacterium]|jgi:NTE family protein
MQSPKIGVALGSGSARGWAHVGVLQALEDIGIRPSVVCGSSAGAFVGAAYATGNLEALAEWALELRTRDVIGMLDLAVGRGGMIAGTRVLDFLRDHEGEHALIEDLECRFAAVATELKTGREIWLQQGSILEAVRASISFPGMVAPVLHQGRWLVDGGLVNPVPTSVCRALGADVVIAVNLNAALVGWTRESARSGTAAGEPVVEQTHEEPEEEEQGDPWRAFKDRFQARFPALANHGRRREGKPPAMMEVVLGSILVMQDRITRSRMAGDPPEVLLSPQLPSMRLLDFDEAEVAIAAGRECVEGARELLERAVGISAQLA